MTSRPLRLRDSHRLVWAIIYSKGMPLPVAFLQRLGPWLGRVSIKMTRGRVRFGDLRRVEPISREFGFDRGLPVDRHYIERFLSAHSSDIRGRVLEIGDNIYTRKFGRVGVTRSDVLHVKDGNLNATIVADLTRADHLPSEVYDCIIFTQTLQFIYDVRAAIRTLHKILRKGGVLLATFSGITKISRDDMEQWGDYWRFTTLSARLLFEEAFSHECVEVEAYGNVLAATGFLYGLAADELRPEELNYSDPDYEVLVALRATK